MMNSTPKVIVCFEFQMLTKTKPHSPSSSPLAAAVLLTTTVHAT
jgi:hypothetical protein